MSPWILHDFQWYVENQQPENVTITLRHAGLNDGFAEGLGFTLSGEKQTQLSKPNFILFFSIK
jgi:hypothetical protein